MWTRIDLTLAVFKSEIWPHYKSQYKSCKQKYFICIINLYLVVQLVICQWRHIGPVAVLTSCTLIKVPPSGLAWRYAWTSTHRRVEQTDPKSFLKVIKALCCVIWPLGRKIPHLNIKKGFALQLRPGRRASALGHAINPTKARFGFILVDKSAKLKTSRLNLRWQLAGGYKVLAASALLVTLAFWAILVTSTFTFKLCEWQICVVNRLKHIIYQIKIMITFASIMILCRSSVFTFCCTF